MAALLQDGTRCGVHWTTAAPLAVRLKLDSGWTTASLAPSALTASLTRFPPRALPLHETRTSEPASCSVPQDEGECCVSSAMLLRYQYLM